MYDAVETGETASSLYSMKEKYAALELMAVHEHAIVVGEFRSPTGRWHDEGPGSGQHLKFSSESAALDG